MTKPRGNQDVPRSSFTTFQAEKVMEKRSTIQRIIPTIPSSKNHAANSALHPDIDWRCVHYSSDILSAESTRTNPITVRLEGIGESLFQLLQGIILCTMDEFACGAVRHERFGIDRQP